MLSTSGGNALSLQRFFREDLLIKFENALKAYGLIIIKRKDWGKMLY